jgi:hypothetical protein
MTTQPTSTRTTSPGSTITRGALAAALLVLAGLIVWLSLLPPFTGQPGVQHLFALVPVAAAGLLFVRRGLGATLSVISAVLGALFGLILSVCFMCGTQPPLRAEVIAVYVTALVILALALIELRTLRLGWVIIPIAIVFLVLANNLIAAGVVVVVAVVWLLVRRRRSSSSAPASEG